MSKRLGSGLFATHVRTTSKANEEILPTGHLFYRLEFVPLTNCTVVLNDDTTVEVVGRVGISIDEVDMRVVSLKVKESGTKYIVAGKY